MTASGPLRVDPTATSPAPRNGLFRQIGSFVVIGVLAAVIDFSVYHLLLNLGLYVPVSKGISFILGTTTAYLLNKRYTFTGSDTGGKGRFAAFVALYGTTFAVNVGVNSLALALIPLPPGTLAESVAWVIAQGTATVINFVMLRTVVFRAR
ncbi:GtrA family protein [Pseudonocardia endophytica]|uniref:Putative flippase GtrA n=1 Tax=Pseudonocardia endophytica TaxID=401976 RepID=A0A4R1HY76_PSEEN|nr:GtrA family protein [Pseudonocardia endophytica]TCK27348.1 putative flippase GtrA [Pseudonocardia endophytica]